MSDGLDLPGDPERRLARRFSMISIALIFASVIAAASCGSNGSENVVPSDGAGLYAENCASCHGADLGGTDTGPSHLSIVYEPNHHGDDSFRSAVRNGSPQHHWTFGDMEPIPGLTDAEVESIIAFVRAEQERLGFESD